MHNYKTSNQLVRELKNEGVSTRRLAAVLGVNRGTIQFLITSKRQKIMYLSYLKLMVLHEMVVINRWDIWDIDSISVENTSEHGSISIEVHYADNQSQ